MTRPRTGSAYLKRGVFYIAISLRAGAVKERWVHPCPPRNDGVPTDHTHARAVAAELQRRYDAGEWDPERDVRLPSAANATPTAPATTSAAASASEPLGTGEAARLPGVTVLEFSRSWIATQRYESAPKDARIIEHYLAPAPLAVMPVADLKPKHVLAFIRWLQDRPSERGGTLAPRSVRNVYDVVRRALDAAVIEELLAANPCAPIRGRLPAIEDKDPLARQGWLYQRDEIVRLVTDPCILPVRRMSYALQFLTGLRVGELAVLRWKDYDATMQPLGRLTISRAVKSVSFREAQTKTAAVKLVPVHPTLAVILDTWKATGWAEYRGRPPEREDLVVPNQFGKVRNTNRHNRDLGRDCKRIGIEHRHQHAMRHTFITLVQDDGGDGSVIRWITHAPPRTAFDGYTRTQWSRLCTELVKLRIEIPQHA